MVLAAAMSLAINTHAKKHGATRIIRRSFLLPLPSLPQVSSSAYDAAAQLWPHFFDGLPDAERQRVMAGMRATRPRLVKGFEAMVGALFRGMLMVECMVCPEQHTGCVPASWNGSAPCVLLTLWRCIAWRCMQVMARLILEDGR